MRRIPFLLAALALAWLTSPSLAEDPEANSIDFVASNLFSTANGTFHTWRIAESRIDPADPAGSFVRIEVDLASVDTGIEDRDEHLRTTDFFDVATYPKAKVRVHGGERIEGDGSGPERYRARFDIDLHGVKKTLDGEFSVLSRDPAQVEGSLVIDRLDFGIGDPQRVWNPMSITEEIPVSFRASIPR